MIFGLAENWTKSTYRTRLEINSTNSIKTENEKINTKRERMRKTITIPNIGSGRPAIIALLLMFLYIS